MLPLAILKVSNFAAVAYNVPCDPTTANPKAPVFGFPHWWAYIHNGRGDPLGAYTPTLSLSGGPGPFLAIGVAVIDMLRYRVGGAAVAYLRIVGSQYRLAGEAA